MRRSRDIPMPTFVKTLMQPIAKRKSTIPTYGMNLPIPPCVVAAASWSDDMVVTRWHDLDYVAAIALGFIEDDVIDREAAYIKMQHDVYLPIQAAYGYSKKGPKVRTAGPGVTGLPKLTGSTHQIAWAQDLRGVCSTRFPESKYLGFATKSGFWIWQFKDTCAYMLTDEEIMAEANRIGIVKAQMREHRKATKGVLYVPEQIAVDHDRSPQVFVTYGRSWGEILKVCQTFRYGTLTPA